MKQNQSQRRGRFFEELAYRYLQEQGLEPVAQNYRCRGGEIDLVMIHRDTLVFIEVRYRKHAEFGSGAESVDIHKQRRIVHCAQLFLQNHPGYQDHMARFDVVSLAPAGVRLRIEWIRNAFDS